jgi:hypothetical protein
MNLTVGPLPPAVYWRRRALVAGALLVLVLLVSYACGGSDGSTAAGQQPAGLSTATSSPDPSPSVLSPIIGAGPASGSPSSSASAGGGVPTGGAPATVDFCTDDEMQITPAIQKITGGTYPYEMTLTIKNISTRSCKRDVGTDPQELHVVQNGQTVWSSDYCQDAHGQRDVRTFGPGIESRFTRGWDGSVGQACANPTPAAAGTYQLVAKLDTKVSAPVTFTIPGK